MEFLCGLQVFVQLTQGSLHIRANPHTLSA